MTVNLSYDAGGRLATTSKVISTKGCKEAPVSRTRGPWRGLRHRGAESARVGPPSEAARPKGRPGFDAGLPVTPVWKRIGPVASQTKVNYSAARLFRLFVALWFGFLTLRRRLLFRLPVRWRDRLRTEAACRRLRRMRLRNHAPGRWRDSDGHRPWRAGRRALGHHRRGNRTRGRPCHRPHPRR